MATQKDPSFSLLGDPRGIVDAPAKAESAAVEPMAPGPEKRRQVSVKGPEKVTTHNQCAESASVGSGQATQGRGAASSSGNAEVVDARPLQKDDAPVHLPACLLPLKWEEMASHLSREGVVVEESAGDVNWGSLWVKGRSVWCIQDASAARRDGWH